MIEQGREVDLLLLDAPWGSVAKAALGAIARGDIPGISAVIIEGKVRTPWSRNTPLVKRMLHVSPPMEWLSEGH